MTICTGIAEATEEGHSAATARLGPAGEDKQQAAENESTQAANGSKKIGR